MKKVFVKPEIEFHKTAPLTVLADSADIIPDDAVTKVGDGDHVKLETEKTIKDSKDIW